MRDAFESLETEIKQWDKMESAEASYYHYYAKKKKADSATQAPAEEMEEDPKAITESIYDCASDERKDYRKEIQGKRQQIVKMPNAIKESRILKRIQMLLWLHRKENVALMSCYQAIPWL
jgi:hypothetical protein